ncbi:MAG: rod shape-determining protein MreC [Prevotellaceae bacterium]|jgi:rod shape-determining protein MreC|nr:rod shape-determining protein MreC [Prevotellaceae bacterium]
MASILRFLIRYRTTILFLILESIAIILIFNNSNYQKTQFAAYVDSVKGSIYAKYAGIKQYFTLKEENKKLIAENLELHNKLNYYINSDTIRSGTVRNVVNRPAYTYKTAKIIRNSTNKQQNFIILNIGSKQGVRSEMGVISSDGKLIGMIVKTSPNYSSAVSILNTGFIKFSGKLKRTGNYGTISWNGVNINHVQLHDIMQQSDVAVGDTVTTNQHSGVFPENILIGTVEKINIKDGIFYEIDVKLIQNMKLLQNVYVVDIHDKDEINTLLSDE